MARISTYPIDTSVSADDILIGSESPNPGGATKNYKVSDILELAVTPGTVGVIPKYITATSIGDSVIYDNGTDVSIGNTIPKSKLDVSGGIRFGDDADTASSSKAGTLRYRVVGVSPTGYSYVDICMQTGADVYDWVNLKTEQLNQG
jgi:hypothetical protein